MKLEITESQAQNLMDLIDLWFYREIREDKNLDNVMWAWEILDIYKQCKGVVDGNKTQESASENATESDDNLVVDKREHGIASAKSEKSDFQIAQK